MDWSVSLLFLLFNKYKIGSHCEEQFGKNCDAAIFLFLLIMGRSAEEDHFWI